MYNSLLQKTESLNHALTEKVNEFLKPYYPSGELPYLSEKLPFFIKITAYSFVPLLVFSLLKILYPDNSFITAIIIAFLLTIILSTSGIFFGFFQLAYSF